MSGQAEFWDERYRGEGFAFGAAPNAFLVSQSLYLKPGLSVLVPGDGEGRNGVWLAKLGLSVHTVDVSPLGVAKARAFAKEQAAPIHAEIADLLHWNWPSGRFDLAVAIYVHFFDADRPRMHRAMLGALKPGGILIFEAFRAEQMEFQKLYHSGGPKTEDMLCSRVKLEDDFAEASFLLLEEADVDLDEGPRHKGRAAVIRAVIQKPL